MRKLLFLCCFVVLMVSAGMAKDKLTSTWNCAKASDAHSIDVGDQTNHTYSITKTTCTSVKGEVGGVREKTGVGTEFEETMGSTITWHGVFVVTTENGDKINYHYESSGKGMVKDGAFQSGDNKWSMAGGTGKFEHAKGEGMCKGKGNGDGTASWECSGEYSLGK